MTALRRRILIATLIGASAALLAGTVNVLGGLEELEWKSFDLRVRLLGDATPQAPEVKIILIDEASLRMMNPLVGRWPWPRWVHAELIDFLALGGAKAVAFDILFPENERDSAVPAGALGKNDQRMVAAAADAGNVVSAVQLIRDEEDKFNKSLLNQPLPPPFVERFGLPGLAANPAAEGGSNNAYLPIPELVQASHGIGVVEFSSDRDGIFRRTHLLRRYDNGTYPVLSLAALLDDFRPETGPGPSLVLRPVAPDGEPIVIPLLADGNFLIKPSPNLKAFSMSGVLTSIQMIAQGDLEQLPVHPEEFQDKIVFIGGSAVGVEDLKITPFGDLAPGVFLHASILDNIFKRNFLRTPPPGANLLVLLGVSLLMAWTVLLPKQTSARMIGPPLLLGAFLALCLLAFGRNLVLETVAPLGGMCAAWAGSFAWLSSTEGRDKRKIRRMLGQYVSPSVLDSIIDRPGDGLLRAEVGARENLTVLFSDIRGFTSLSEILPAEQVVEVLNGYFSGMVDIIFRYEGTLDKFIGDAIMAFWGAPLRVADHGRRGVEAAVAMVRWLEQYNAGLAEKGLAGLAIGVGLHTGEVILGNIGSEKKLDYTIIGDNVNLGSRLEGLTKTYGCGIIVSETTLQAVTEFAICRVVDAVRVKGKLQPITIYEVLGLNSDPPHERAAMQAIAAGTAAGFACYRNRDWTGAVAAYAQVLAARPDDPLSRLFIDRAEHYQQEDPGTAWDGVFTLKTK